MCIGIAAAKSLQLQWGTEYGFAGEEKERATNLSNFKQKWSSWVAN